LANASPVTKGCSDEVITHLQVKGATKMGSFWNERNVLEAKLSRDPPWRISHFLHERSPSVHGGMGLRRRSRVCDRQK